MMKLNYGIKPYLRLYRYIIYIYVYIYITGRLQTVLRHQYLIRYIIQSSWLIEIHKGNPPPSVPSEVSV